MAVTTIIDGSAASPAVSTDDGNTVVLMSREPSRSGSNTQTVDTWEGTTAAILEYFAELSENSLITDINVTQNGGKATLRATWRAINIDGDTPEPEDGDEWGMDFIEIPTPLAAHPYFQKAYVEGSGVLIEDEIARADSAIKRGRSFTASGIWADWAARYYALRMAGVEEWTQYGVSVSRKFTAEKPADAKRSTDDMGVVIAAENIGMPSSLLAAINNIPRIDRYDSADPASYQIERGGFEFVERPPQIAISAVNTIERFDITATWWGLAEWSAVIYPEGSWDPIGDTE